MTDETRRNMNDGTIVFLTSLLIVLTWKILLPFSFWYKIISCFSVNIPKDLATSFFETTPVAAFDYVLVPEFLEKKVSRDIAFEFISLFHVQYESLQVCQLSQEHLSFLQNLLNFIITKYFKQEVDDDLSLCVVESSHCGLSITEDIKIYQCHLMKR